MTDPTEPPPGGYGAPEAGYGAPTGASALPAGVAVATMGQRLLARIVDWVIIAVVAGIIYGISGGFPSGDFETGEQTGAGIGAQLLVGLLAIAYEVVLIALRGQTIGKMALKVKVVREADGQVPGWSPSILRYLIQLVGAVLCGIGLIVVWLSPFFDGSGKRQGWHDKVAKTVVIKAAQPTRCASSELPSLSGPPERPNSGV